MVFYFESNVISPPVLIYVGRDKHENEDLIRWGWPEDVWFHTDKLSSAHIYLRLPEGMTIDTIPAELLNDCCQLTKANSIEGCKQNNVAIVYTPWANLKKTGDMAVGQVGFQKQKEVRRIMVETKINVIINRLNKTKVEKEIDYRALREQRDQAEQREAKKKIQEEKALKKLADAEKAEQKELENYTSLMVESNMTSNVENPIDEDDFM